MRKLTKASRIKATLQIGKNIALARERRGMTQVELGKKTGLSPVAISHFECGRRAPDAHNLRRLSLALNESADFILELPQMPYAA